MHISGGDINNELSECCNRLSQTVNKYISLLKTGNQLFEDLEPSEDSSSSNGDNTCNDCSGGACNCCYNCYDNNEDMVYSDEPESDNDDFSEESDGGEDDSWRDVDHNMSDNDDVDLFSVHDEDSSNDEDMSEETSELMDAFSDLSEDIPHADNDNFDIAIEVDMASSSSSATRHDDDDDDDDDDFFEEDDNEEEDVTYEDDHEDFVDEVDDRDDDIYVDGFFNSDDTEIYLDDHDSRLSFRSDESSRSRSPVALRTLPFEPPNQPTSVITPVESIGGQGDTAESPQSKILPQNQEKPTDEPSVSNSPPCNTDEKEDTSCCICLDGDSTHVVVPCGHICLCETCSERLLSNQDRKKKKCPLCKTEFSLIIKVYK